MIIAIDTETYRFNTSNGTYEPVLDARAFTIGACKTEKGKTHFFTEREDMYQWLIQKIESNIERGKRTFIYGHNHEYDWYSYAHNHLLEADIKYITFNPLIAIYKEKGYFLDTMAFYKMSLEAVGDILGVPKLTMPKSITNIDEIKPYLERDVEITLQAILTLKEQIQTLGFNPRKLMTAGQVAMTAFWTYCTQQGIIDDFASINPHNKLKTIYKTKYPQFIRQAYRGANTTAFQTGKHANVTQIDINGHYADQMRKKPFPDLRTEQYHDTPSIEYLQSTLPQIGIAQCTIQAPNIPIGYLPIRYGGYTHFPTNKTLTGTWTYIELRTAQELGYKITKCHWLIWWYPLKNNPLKAFIEHLYELEKSKTTKEEKAPIKLIRNNLYGKFAQYRTQKDYKLILRKDIDDALQQGYTVAGTTANKYIIQKELSPYDPHYTNPIISTLITAAARDRLYKELIKIPKEDLLYCDTDSIILKGDHLHKYDMGNELGQFKIEAQGTTKILGEKRYYIADKTHISGLPRRQANTSVIEKEENIQTQKLIGLRQAIHKGDMTLAGAFETETKEMKIHSKAMMPLPNSIDETTLPMTGDEWEDYTNIGLKKSETHAT